jgi:hypothetical protein
MEEPERDAYVYARVKAIMTLRTFGDLRGTSGLWHRRFSLPAVVAGAAILVTLFAGASGAGVTNYQGTLYLDGPESTIASANSFQLLTSAGPAAPATPIVTAGSAGSGTLAAGNYLYVAVAVSGSARTAGTTAQVSSVPANGSVNVSNVAVGSLVYRLALGATTATSYTLVTPTSGAASTSFVDSGVTSTNVLPQSENRVALGSTGYADFTPGTVYSTGSSAAPVAAASITAPTTCAGWVVDGDGEVTLPAGTWTFQVRIRSAAAGAANASAIAHLVAAMYVVNASGTVTSTVVPPTEGGTNLITTAAATNTVTLSATTASASALAKDAHLCVQFWRRQTAAYSSSGSKSALTILPYDLGNAITVHPAPNAFATAALSSPADSLQTQAIPTLTATYSDPEGDAGNITIRVCADAGCSSPVTSGAIAANNGETKSWTPAGLADGTYYWSAQAQDAGGLPSAWTASRTFTVDNAAPTIAFDSAPSASSNAASGSVTFHANEPVTGYQCHVDAAAFSACASPASYGPLTDGPHTFSVRAVADLAGNAGTTSSTGWTIDTVPPDTSITAQPSALSNSAAPSFSFSATQVGSSFECKLDAASFTSCTSPQAYSGVADGAHIFQVRAIDPAGNVDATPVSYAWTIDATPPDTSIGPSKPAALTVATGATFDFSSNEPGSTFACKLDAGSFAACTTPKTYSALADGSHTFQVQATDTAANTDPTPASYTWTIDTTPPVTSIGPTTPAGHTPATSATFDLASNESGSTFECSLDGSPYAGCTTPKTYSALGDGSHTFSLRATDQAGNVDTSPVSYSWAIDNVKPSTPTLVSPADATLTNAIPQLGASFDDATAGGDTGTVQFQLCSAAAAAGTACASVVQSGVSASLSSGGTASWTPSALPDGTYHWQARATDAAGNQSGWTATRSFQLDTSAPAIPGGDVLADGAWVPRIQLAATFSKPSFAGTGELEFRICSDGMCLGVVRSGTSGLLVNGEQTTWSPSTQPGDGLWYWQVRSHDSAGNTSAWSPTRVVHLDSLAPGKPVHFNGVVAADGLTLRWDAPNDTIANYVVFVNGTPWKNLGSTEFEVKLGPYDATDGRTFSVVAVDLAGNVGVMSPVLVGVPSLVGLDWSEAVSAASARGLTLKRDAAAFPSLPMFVAMQDPPSPALVEQGSAVGVTLAAPKGAPLAVRVRPGKVNCKRGCVLRLRVELSSAASVRSRLLSGKGRLVRRTSLGTLHAGANSVRVVVPKRIGKGAYRLLFDAMGQSGNAHAYVRIFVA